MSLSKNSKIYVAGHNGMVGSAICRKLESLGYKNLIKESSNKLDLRNSLETEHFFKSKNPEFVFLAAAKVGGILANSTYKADFIYDNIMIQNNVIHCAHKYKVEKLLFLGSSCIYPKKSKQPIKEEYLLSGYLEPTNEPYAIAKIAGLKMCEYYREQYGSNFISAMPTNLYGPNDNFNLETSHVFAALIRKFHEAKIQNHSEVKLWGTGAPKREFLHVDDLADALVFLMKIYNSSSIINIGTGEDISITDLAKKIQKVVGYKGIINWDKSMPDGTFRKWLDVSKINDLGWKANTSLLKGIEMTYDWYSRNFS
jgi:GDP-L-fucose synthase|tara:strand:- start:34 stop:969 length:936 start_codon:yes stop_codon:yes gene_type:complete